METPKPDRNRTSSPKSPDSDASPKSKQSRPRKRKFVSSESSSDTDDILPENTIEIEKNLHASAVKNNLDEVSVKKILKKVVTNDHVLALVKLREEEENMVQKEENMQPKLTRAKVKELMKVSPKSTAPWNLENMELTPIKHIPVKTRPEVTALIAQELPEDEDDEEYEPTNDDVPSDDDHTLESCSDLDSQPRTPATPSTPIQSPLVAKDGPFKVPLDVKTPRRKLNMDEDATIALRTRSKLSLSSIPIDHIESSFVPPDELPMPKADDVWTEFLQEIMCPEGPKNDDDEDDPEYNAATDHDASDEDHDDFFGKTIKISKKELNDLVTELFNIMPEGTAEDVGSLTAEAARVDDSDKQMTNQPIQVHWEGKQEVISDEEVTEIPPAVTRVSIGKSEPRVDSDDDVSAVNDMSTQETTEAPPKTGRVRVKEKTVQEKESAGAPPSLRGVLASSTEVHISIDQGVKMLPEQISILQQQLRQHVQLATSNFLQLYIHPVHWALGPVYKEFVESLYNMTVKKPDSVANVCNLKPALELMRSWESTVSENTPENTEMVKFIHNEAERNRRRASQNGLYLGNFHETFLNVIANSSVFVYPHLLPPVPYRSDGHRRFTYLQSEDKLIALCLDQFWRYVEANEDIFKPRRKETATKHRWGLLATVQQLCKIVFPWISPRTMLCHIQHVRKSKVDTQNPINIFFNKGEVEPVKHILLPFNPEMTLYEQPEEEMPKIWVRHLSKNSKRFKRFRYKQVNRNMVATPRGVAVKLGRTAVAPEKNPLPIQFSQSIKTPKLAPKPSDRFDIELETQNEPVKATVPKVNYSIVETPTGAYLVPVSMIKTVHSVAAPITTPAESKAPERTIVIDSGQICSISVKPKIHTQTAKPQSDHCKCCLVLRIISKERQTKIEDFFCPRKATLCPCKRKRCEKYPKITKKLRLLVNGYKSKGDTVWQGLLCKVEALSKEVKDLYSNRIMSQAVQYDLEEIAAVTSFQLKLTIRTSTARNSHMKKKVHTVLSRFKLDEDDPVVLLEQLYDILEADCVDMYKEFIGFLNPEQADRIGVFLDYFKQELLTGVMKKIEELVQNKRHQLTMLTALRRALRKQNATACEICSAIIDSMRLYPRLAEYVFALFPHKKKANPKENEPIQQTKPREQTQATQEPIKIHLSNPCEEITIIDRTINNEPHNDTLQAIDNTIDNECINVTSQAMDYEADQSDSEDERSAENLTIDEEHAIVTKNDRPSNNNKSELIIDTTELTVSKTEVQEYSETDMSTMAMSDDEQVKLEAPEWKRDEDKLVLEVLKQILTPEERKDKTILEILEEKKVLDLLTESLSHKSVCDVKDRMLYLLQLLVMTE